MLKISNLKVKYKLQWLVLIVLFYFCSVTTLKTLFIVLNKHEMLSIFMSYNSIFAVVDLMVILILVFAFILYAINQKYWMVLLSTALVVLVVVLNFFGILLSDSADDMKSLFTFRIILILFHAITIFITNARKNMPFFIWGILISVITIAYGNLVNAENYELLAPLMLLIGLAPLVFVFLIFNEMKITKTAPTQSSEILDHL